MRNVWKGLVICLAAGAAMNGCRLAGVTRAPEYAVAVANMGPLNTDIFVADADGSRATPLLAHPDLDYNASFSRDGAWIVFTSERAGSADIYRVHPDGSGLERLTEDPAFDDQAALSPDGASLAFVSSRTGQADIWLLEVATGTVRNLSNHAGGDFRPSWSADGQWLAFSSDRDSIKPRPSVSLGTFVTLHSTEIYVIRRDGSGLRRITQATAFSGSPAWSPDGSRLVMYEASLDDVRNITNPRRFRGTTQLATIDVNTGDRQVLVSSADEKSSPRWLAQDRIAYASGGPGGGIEFVAGSPGTRGEFGSPDWSPDGRRMVFHREQDRNWPPVRERHSRDPQFRVVRTGVFPSYAPSGDRLVSLSEPAASLHNRLLLQSADGTRRSVLFGHDQKSTMAPVWSPQGDRIAFGLGEYFQGAARIADVAIVRSDGSDLRILTDGTGNDGFPSWSPDGKRIVYRSANKTGKGLAIIDVETGSVTRLTTGSQNDNFPSWSPRGDAIAFVTDRDGDYEIYAIKPDGTNIRRLTNSPGNDAHLSWSPDGEWIAFTSARGGFKDESALHPYNPQPYGEIYVMRADGSDVRMLTDNQYEDGTPSWIPLRPPQAGR